ncbi:transposase [Stigmatella aurantiaca DW4/3-1]|uniref:Transposase n=1 Tax=Stigmatella aurantiaca (strain DW4/3-1) TaxID=378806 RepID=E3FF39_STIAD|nr:transposase [Stigmatella aurantiaca DW4/3-1]
MIDCLWGARRLGTDLGRILSCRLRSARAVTVGKNGRMRIFVKALVETMLSALRGRSELVLENLVLRQQLAVFRETRPSPFGAGCERVHGSAQRAQPESPSGFRCFPAQAAE